MLGEIDYGKNGWGIVMTVRKYMSLQLYTFENLVNQQLMFADPYSFNDIYDCFLLHDDDFIKTLQFKESSDLNRIRVLCVRSIDEKESEKTKAEREKYFWTFYGDSHKGICVEFDLPCNSDALCEKNRFYDLELGSGEFDIDKQVLIRKTNYQDDILDNISNLKNSVINRSDFKDVLENTVFLKDKIFEKENEFRLVKFVQDKTKTFEPFSIKEMKNKKIIFGHKCNKSYERLIYNTLIEEGFKFSTMTKTMKTEEYHAQ